MIGPHKGEYGYLAGALRRRALITGGLLAVVLVLYFVPMLLLGTNKNIFTILAAVSALPAGNSAVNLVMLLRARGCSPEAAERIRKAAGSLRGAYDLFMTSYDRNYALSHVAAAGRDLYAYTENTETDCRACEAHMRDVLERNGIAGTHITVTSDLGQYEGYLTKLGQSAAEAVEQTDETEGVMNALLAASL